MEFKDFSLLTVAYSLGAFILLFSIAFVAYPDDKYSANIDLTADNETPEQVIRFDNRNVTLRYNDTGSNYLIVEGREEELNIEGRQNDIFAVDGKVYMFYFEAGEEFIRMIRVEQL